MKNVKIYAYSGPVPKNWNQFRESDFRNKNYKTKKQYTYLKECNFDGIISLMDRTEAHAEEGLKLADRVGIEYYVRDLINWLPCYHPDFFVMRQEFYARCAAHPSFAGIFICDEPEVKEYPALAKFKESFDAFFGKKENGYFVNLLPTYANEVVQLGAPYHEYIERYITTVKNDHVCFDNYPFQKKVISEERKEYEDHTREDYYYNFQIVADACDRHGVDLWAFVQSQNHTRRKTDLDFAALSFQIYSCLAYGAKGLVYYCYWTWPGECISDKDKTFPPALISAQGKRLEKYYYSQRLNGEAHVVGELLTNAKHIDSYQVQGEHLYFEGTRIKKMPCGSASDALLVGEFEKKTGERAYVFVNATDPYERIENKIKIDLPRFVAYVNGVREEKQGGWETTLAAGQGIVVEESK